MINKENKKLIFGIILAALVFLSYQVIASYMTNPVDSNLKYPNPGHYPGEIGPGTFNCSGTGSNCYFKFTDDFGNTGLKIINGTTEIYKGLHVASGYPLVVDSDAYLGNDSSDKTIVKGDLEVSGNTALGDAITDRVDVSGELYTREFGVLGDLQAGGDASITGNLDVSGNTQLGDSSSDKTIVKGDLEVTEKLNANKGIKVGDSPITCNTSTEGIVKYNYAEHRLEVCNSTDWVSVSAGISCVNLCPSEGDTRCVGNVLQTCGDWDADICLEWGNDDDCSDCSCSCGDYGKASEIGFCSDGKDNDCDGFNDSNDCDCVGTGTCSCTGTGWCGKKINGDVVYVDCNADKCWSPTAANRYAWGPEGEYAGGNCTSHEDNSSYPACYYCAHQIGNNGTYGGFSDWHLPDEDTLANLCNSDSCSGTCFGDDGSTDYYWSSTEVGTYGFGARWVKFESCSSDPHFKRYLGYVRCVRD